MRFVDADLLDAAKRASGIINTYVAGLPWDEIKNKFIAVRLSDGGSDGVLYDSKRDAVKHQSDEFLCAYVALRNLGPAGSNPKELVHFLAWNRQAYAAGFRLPDPDSVNGGPDMLPSTTNTSSVKDLAAITPQEIARFRKELGLS